MAWQLPLLLLPRTTFLLMSATLGDTTLVQDGLHELTGRRPVVVDSTERPVPLEFSYVHDPLHETIQSLMASTPSNARLWNATTSPSHTCASESCQG